MTHTEGLQEKGKKVGLPRFHEAFGESLLPPSPFSRWQISVLLETRVVINEICKNPDFADSMG